jgi:fibronectin type 3 domain-containing protein
MTRQTVVAGAFLTVLCVLALPGQAWAATPPVNAAIPTVSGTAREGQTLTASSGSWGGSLPIAYAYAWQRCDPSGARCSAIARADNPTYRLTASDVGHTVRVKVTASNSAGGSSVFSAPSGVVAKAGSAPAATGQPTPSGTAQVGQTLTASDSTWSGTTPMTFTYQWQRCVQATGACTSVSDATHKTYTLVGADLGYRLRYLLTAHNSVGTGSINSNLSAVVIAAGKPPDNVEPPIIYGDPTVGKVVQVGTGVWSGIGKTANFAYDWQRCTPSGACAKIPGATSSSYLVASADAGQRLRAQVTASNSAGKTTATSAEVAVASGGAGGGGGGAVVPVTSLKANPDHLLISDVKFSPTTFSNPGGSFTMKVKVMLEGTNKAVSGALVYVTCIPYGWVQGQAPETPTGSDGWVTLKIHTTKKLPHSGALVMQVRARGPGNSETDILGGISTRRLVQITLK